MINSAKPLVEVILPTYMTGEANCPVWLDAAINSVLQQSWTHWHLTLVDDASPTDRLAPLFVWVDQYPDQISLIRRNQQGGAATARMDAADSTDADILTFLDQDDLWLPRKLERQVNYFLRHRDFAAVHTNILVIDETSNNIDGAEAKENAARNNVAYEDVTNQQLACHLFRFAGIRLVSSAVKRSEFLSVGGFDKTLQGGEDWEFWIRFADQCRIGHIAEPLIKRRVHGSNTSKIQRFDRTKGQLIAFNKLLRAHPYLAEHAEAREQRLLKSIERLSAQQ